MHALKTRDPMDNGRSPLDRLLALFAVVRAGEGATALILTLNVFLLLTAYYLLKVAREPLILLQGGAEVKSFAAAGQSVILVFVTSAYSAIAKRVDAVRLISIVQLFFVSNLLLFATLATLKVRLGVPFYLWVGVFNVTVIAQFWAFAADLYSDEQGKRLFPIVGIGSSVGAVAGAGIAKSVLGLGPAGLMVAASCLLLGCLALTLLVHRRETRAPQRPRVAVDQPLAGPGGFSMLLGDRYLLLLGALTLLINWVNTTGEYVLDRTLLAVAAPEAARVGLTTPEFVGRFKAEYFQWVNALGLLLQFFAVSRVIRYLGLRAALFIMPVVSLAGYSAIGLAPVLSLVFMAKVAENSLDYSLSNTARQALWLVTSRAAKYKAKQVIDTFLVRAGDVMSAVCVWVGLHLSLETPHFLAMNMALGLLWMLVLVLLGREYARRSRGAGLLEPAATPEG